MTDEVVTSASNPLVKRLRKLRQKRYRDEESAFVVEGIHPVLQALEAGADVQVLVTAPELLRSDTALASVRAAGERGIAVARLGADAFRSFSDRDAPTGIAAIVSSHLGELEDLNVTERSLFVCLEDAANPGNLGAIVRTADAVGADGVVLVGDSTDPFHPAAVKSSMGTLFHTAICRATSLAAAFEWCVHHKVGTVTTSARAPVVCWDAVFSLPSMCFFGSEGSGLSTEAIERGDLAVRLPMGGRATSLNLAVAAGILLYEVRRQTGFPGDV